MADTPQTAQEWAWYYLRHRLGPTIELLRLSENLPQITTFADLKEEEFFIRFPMFRVENDKLIFINTELYRKTRAVRYKDEPNNYYTAMKVVIGSFHEIPDNEPVIVVR